MTTTREIFGEIEGRRVINKGDNVRVVYFFGSERKELTGILISVTKSEIEVNGTAPKTKILIERIVSIEKV